MILAALEIGQIATLIGAVAGAGLGAAGLISSRKTAETAADESYVDTNLRTMQQTIEWQNKDNVNLRATIDAQRIQITDLTKDLARVMQMFDDCQRKCDDVSARLRVFEAAAALALSNHHITGPVPITESPSAP